MKSLFEIKWLVIIFGQVLIVLDWVASVWVFLFLWSAQMIEEWRGLNMIGGGRSFEFFVLRLVLASFEDEFFIHLLGQIWHMFNLVVGLIHEDGAEAKSLELIMYISYIALQT